MAGMWRWRHKWSKVVEGWRCEGGGGTRLGSLVAEVLRLEMDAGELTYLGEANRDRNN